MKPAVSREPVRAPELLRAFLDFGKNANWSEIEKAIADPNIPSQQFYGTIPEPIADFAVVLRTPILFESLRAHAPKDAQAALNSAKDLADTHLSGIEQHPLITSHIREKISDSAIEETQNQPSGMLTEFTRFGAFPMWAETNDGLVPLTAIALLGSDEKELLRATIDWDDLSFFAFVLTRLLHQEFKRINKMSEVQKLDLRYAENVLERIAQMEEAVQEMHQLAAKMRLSKRESS